MGSKNRMNASCADELRAAISGPVALPGEELYDEGSRVWNGAVRRRPARTAACTSSGCLQNATIAGRRHGLPLSVPAIGLAALND